MDVASPVAVAMPLAAACCNLAVMRSAHAAMQVALVVSRWVEHRFAAALAKGGLGHRSQLSIYILDYRWAVQMEFASVLPARVQAC